jgi:hypothetical protein
VEVAERSAAHGGRLAAEPGWHDVMTSLKHGSTLSVRDGYTPHAPATPQDVFSNSFNAVELRVSIWPNVLLSRRLNLNILQRGNLQPVRIWFADGVRRGSGISLNSA